MERWSRSLQLAEDASREARSPLEYPGDANRISEAPFVKLQALMYASLARRAAGGQKELPNEGTDTDIETVAHLLPYCDAMLGDNGCRSLLLNVPMELRPAIVAVIFVPVLPAARLIRRSIGHVIGFSS